MLRGERRLKRLTLAAALALTCGLASAAEPDRIEPDRPNFTNGTTTVSPGAFQVETGLVYGRERIGGSRAERRLAEEVTARVGVGDRLELRVEGEPLVWLRGDDDDFGLGDLELAARWRVIDGDEGRRIPSIALQPFAKLPTAREPIGAERPDFGLVGAASFALPSRFKLELNAGVAAVGQSRPDGFLAQAILAALIGRTLSDNLDGFAEALFTTREERDGRDQLSLNVGVVWTLTRRLALDAAIATSVMGHAPDYEVRAGLSVRFGK